jgi:hypothetical protein
MPKAKEPRSPASKTAKPTATRAAPQPAAGSTANRRPAKAAPDAPSSEVIQTAVSSRRADLSAEEIYKLIQETAYYKAKARGFAPGHEVQDWIEAEAEVRMRLDSRA